MIKIIRPTPPGVQDGEDLHGAVRYPVSSDKG